MKKIIYNNWHHIATLFFFVGFIVDGVFLPDYMDPMSRYLGALYILAASLLLILKNNAQLLAPTHNKLLLRLYTGIQSLYTRSKIQNWIKIEHIINFALALLIGSLLSYVFIYYYRSVQFVVMWPLLIGLFALMCINEFVRSEMRRNMIEIGIIMFAMYLYSVYVFPTIFYNLTNYTLILSMVFALLYNMFLTRMLVWGKSGDDTQVNRFGYGLLLANISAPIIVGLLYITNNLPAVPVTLKDVQVYNSVNREVVKNNSVYTYRQYDANCYDSVGRIVDQDNYWKQAKELFFKRTVYIGCHNQEAASTTNMVSVYTAVYIPGYFFKMNQIVTVWEYYDENKNSWQTIKNIAYPIASGRDAGYRGYTSVNNPKTGLWRVRILNNDTRLIGEYRFKIEKANL